MNLLLVQSEFVGQGADRFWPSLVAIVLVGLIGAIVTMRWWADRKDEAAEEAVHYQEQRTGHVTPVAEPVVHVSFAESFFDYEVECPEERAADNLARYHRNRTSLAGERRKRQLVKDGEAAAFYKGKRAAEQVAEAQRPKARQGK